MIKRSCRKVKRERHSTTAVRSWDSMVGCGTWRCQPVIVYRVWSRPSLSPLLLFWPNNKNTMGDEEVWRNRGWFGCVVASIKGRLGAMEAYRVSPPLASQSTSISLPSSSSFSFSLLLRWRSARTCNGLNSGIGFSTWRPGRWTLVKRECAKRPIATSPKNCWCRREMTWMLPAS